MDRKALGYGYDNSSLHSAATSQRIIEMGRMTPAAAPLSAAQQTILDVFTPFMTALRTGNPSANVEPMHHLPIGHTGDAEVDIALTDTTASTFATVAMMLLRDRLMVEANADVITADTYFQDEIPFLSGYFTGPFVVGTPKANGLFILWANVLCILPYTALSSMSLYMVKQTELAGLEVLANMLGTDDGTSLHGKAQAVMTGITPVSGGTHSITVTGPTTAGLYWPILKGIGQSTYAGKNFWFVPQAPVQVNLV